VNAQVRRLRGAEAMVTQINPSSIGSVGVGATNLGETGSRPKLTPISSAPRNTAPAAVDSTDPQRALSSIREELANAVTALDVAMRAGKAALAELAGGADNAARFTALLDETERQSAGLLTGGTLAVRAGPDGGVVEIVGIDARRIGADSAGMQQLSETLARFSAIADKLSMHAQFVEASAAAGLDVNGGLDADQARLTALSASQGLRETNSAIANAAPLSLLAFFRD